MEITTKFQNLVLRALGAILYQLMYKDNELMARQGHDARKNLIKELRDRSCLTTTN